MSEELAKYQSKSVFPVDEYVCTLSDELQKIAEEELRENEQIRRQGIKTMRDWALNNPRILKCRLDSTFLLNCLRFRKYSIPMTQEMYERYLLYREGLYGYDWFSNLDPFKPHVFTLLERGLILPMPKRDKLGRKVILVKLSEMDTSIPDVGSCALTLLTLIMLVLMDIEENQVRGLVYVADFSGISVKQALVFPLDVWFKFGKNTEKTCPIRHKGFNICNLPQSLIYVINFAIGHMPEKLKNRVNFYTCSIADTELLELDNLPKEFGGNIPLKEITDEWKQIFTEKRDYFLSLNQMAVNRKLYPKAVLECSPESLKTPISSMDLMLEKKKENDFPDIGIQGNFRRLEID